MPITPDPSVQRTVVRKKKEATLSGLLHQAIFMMQAAKHRCLHNAVTGWHLVPVVACRNLALVGFGQAKDLMTNEAAPVVMDYPLGDRHLQMAFACHAER